MLAELANRRLPAASVARGNATCDTTNCERPADSENANVWEAGRQNDHPEVPSWQHFLVTLK